MARTIAPEPQNEDLEAKDRRIEALRKMHAWVTAWTEMARTVITRRDQLIRLGIARRRPHKGKNVIVTPPAPVVAPVAPPVAVPATPSTPVAPVMPIRLVAIETPITNADGVAAWTDSICNASVPEAARR